jgi:Zn-finger nucleic acid-binding protein
MSDMRTSLRCACGSESGWLLVEVADGLPAANCRACSGHLMALDDYRRWHERAGATDVADVATIDLPPSDATDNARHCPHCARFMQRLRVGAPVDFRIDRCSPCQQVWFDDGEWTALSQAGLAQRLLDVLSDGWQRQVRTDDVRERRQADLCERHGAERLHELARMRDWLNAQPQREELLALLRAGW